MRIEDIDVPDNLHYTKEHQWLLAEGERCRIGLTDYAQKQLHEIVFIDLPGVGGAVNAGQAIGSVESVKTLSDIFSPVSGDVLEVNKSVQDSPGVINKSPYQDGWLVILKASKLKEELKSLLSAEAYGSHIRALLEAK